MAYAIRKTLRPRRFKRRPTTRKYKPAPKYRRKTYRKPAMSKLKALTQSVETKVHGTRSIESLSVVSALGKTYKCCWTTAPVDYDSFTQQGTLTFPQGDTRNSRQGSKMYLKAIHLKMNIFMDGWTDSSLSGGDVNTMKTYSDMKFRLIMFKFRQTRSNAVYQPSTDLFINESGERKGFSSSGMIGPDYMTYLVNTKRYDVLYQRYFSLSPPIMMAYNTATSNKTYGMAVQGKHPSEININRKVSFNKPIYFDNSSTSNPIGDNNIYCVIFSTSVDRSADANGWNCNLYTTATCLDN